MKKKKTKTHFIYLYLILKFSQKRVQCGGGASEEEEGLREEMEKETYWGRKTSQRGFSRPLTMWERNGQREGGREGRKDIGRGRKERGCGVETLKDRH